MTYGQPYATCSVCRQPFAITKGGNIYPHKGARGMRCPGAGRLPLKDHRLGYSEDACTVCGKPDHEAWCLIWTPVLCGNCQRAGHGPCHDRARSAGMVPV